MKTKNYVVITLLLITCLVMPVLGLLSSKSISSYGIVSYSSGMGWLRTDGRYIKDESGRDIILHGVNLDIQGIPNRAIFKQRNNVAVEETIDLIKQVGAKIIRLAVDGALWGRTDYVDLIDAIVTLSADAGIYVAIDHHQWNGTWTAQEKADMIMNVTSQQPWLDFWFSVANHYKNQPAVLYSIFNEPQKAGYSLNEIRVAWYNLALKASRIIHAANPKALILVSTFSDSNKKIVYFDQHPLPEPNVVYVWHDYYANDLYLPNRGFRYAQAYAAGDFEVARVELEQLLKDAVFFMLDLNLPIIIEEFGATQTFFDGKTGEYYPVPNWDREIQDRYGLYDKYGLTWIQWVWKRITLTRGGYGLLNDDGRTLNLQGELLAQNI